MKTMINSKMVLFSVIMITLSVLFSFVSNDQQQKDEWVVPNKYKKMENPTKADKKTMALVAKQLYLKNCQSCHGKQGQGDGPRAKILDSYPVDLSTPSFQSQTDGELFYKISEGRGDMACFKKRIGEDEERWMIVHYLRTFTP